MDSQEQQENNINVHFTDKDKVLIQKSIRTLEKRIKKLQKKNCKSTEIDNETIKMKLQLRNTKRFLSMGSKEVFCYEKNRLLKHNEYPACWFCQFGHFLECHYPFTCSSLFCNHYQKQRELEKELEPELEKHSEAQSQEQIQESE